VLLTGKICNETRKQDSRSPHAYLYFVPNTVPLGVGTAGGMDCGCSLHNFACECSARN